MKNSPSITTISNKTSNNFFINIKKSRGIKSSSPKIVKIIKSYSTKNQNIFLKNLKKRKKLIEKYIPKNKKIKSYIELNYNLYQGKRKITKINKNMDKDSIPIINKIITLQKKIEKNNSIIKGFSEENKLFQKRYNLAMELQQKSNNKKKLINLKENFSENNVFNKGILLSGKDINIKNIKKVIDIKECNEDLKIINNLKSNFNEGNNKEFSFYAINNSKEEENKKIDIDKMKKEIEITKKALSDFEKNRDIFVDLDENRRKSIGKLKNKINRININNDKKHKTLIPSLALSLSDNKGSYKLVTRCDIHHKTNSPNKKKLQNISNKFKLYNFYNEYNRVKKILAPTSKSKNSPAKFVLNSNFELRKKLIDKNKFFSDEKKCFETLSLSLDLNTEINNKSNDINNLYYYLKFNNYERTNHLFSSYIKKYKRNYDLDSYFKRNGIELNPILGDIKQNSIKYNISNKMKSLNNSKYIDLNLFQNIKRKNNINKVKQFDDRMKMVDFDSVDQILDLNQDLIKI